MDSSSLANGDRQLHHDLVEWLRERMTKGITEPMLRVGSIEVRPGDWLLQRNPSPYNRFTDISPGLFTHIAIVTEEVDDQGKRRIVAVDMPERSAHVPATNAETFLARSLHYVVLRPRDAATASKLAATAAETIGNEAQFDLEFRTDRMPITAGQSLRGQRMHSYCAGFVLACAEAAGFRREAFFPIEENPSSDLCQANLRKLGLSLGDRFVSPTGPLFSDQFTVVGQREPMYDPGREIKEAIYDHFAECMAQRSLNPSPDLFQSLRLRAAQLSRTHAWLARALAQANGVSPEMDLESAARAAAVVETLDTIANEGWQTFEQARTAIMAGTEDDLSAAAISTDQRELFERLRREHSELLRDWLAGRLSPRDVRIRLVQYYSAAGRRRIDERFF
jgi:hypothetical protein